MALCRFGSDSDVYVYYSTHGGIECCGCRLGGDRMVNVATEAEMIVHLEEHRRTGHRVPDEAFQDLRAEIL